VNFTCSGHAIPGPREGVDSKECQQKTGMPNDILMLESPVAAELEIYLTNTQGIWISLKEADNIQIDLNNSKFGLEGRSISQAYQI
jgi:hypothetical protein